MRPKARFTGNEEFGIHEFSDDFQAELRGLLPQEGNIHPVWGHPTDRLVEALLSEARWAAHELDFHRQDVTREEVLAELCTLRKVLTQARDMLRSLSPDVDRLLGSGIDPVGCAESIEQVMDRAVLMNNWMEAETEHNQRERRRTAPVSSARQKRHAIAMELAARVCTVMQERGIAVSATARTHYRLVDITDMTRVGQSGVSRYESKAVELLKLIADEIGLGLMAGETWRDVIAKLKQQSKE